MNVTVVLGVSKKNDSAIIVIANGIVAKMTNNPYFTLATDLAKIAKVKTASLNLQNALESGDLTNKKSIIKQAKHDLHRNLKSLRNLVEDTANDSSISDDLRVIIVESTGMSVKIHSHPVSKVFIAIHGDVKGSILLVVPSGANSNEFQYTGDVVGFTNRITVDSTTMSHIMLYGLPLGPMAFFHKAVFPRKKTDWEGPIIITVI
jgi:hypothetical protein